MYYSALCFIRNKWPLTSSPSFVISPPIPLCLPRLAFSKTHNHLCSCSYPPEVLTAASSVLLLNVHIWISVRCLCLSFIFLMLELMLLCVCVFWMRTWSYCVEFCRKHWTHWSVCSNRRTVSLFRELYEWFGKLCQRNQLSCVSNREKL